MRKMILIGGILFMVFLLLSIIVEQDRYEMKTVTITTGWGPGRSVQTICNYRVDRRTGKTTLVSGGAECPR